MAETIISPGVFTRENDISFIQPAPVTAGAAIIGPAVKGPVEIPTLVTSYGDYVRKFGTTFVSGSNSYEFLTSIAVKNYFQQGGNSVLVSRVVTGSFEPAFFIFCNTRPGMAPIYVFRCPRISASSRSPPKDIRT